MIRDHRERRVLVTGAGGFIGGHLVAGLVRDGYRNVRAVDGKPLEQWYQRTPGVEERQLDLREKATCYEAVEGTDLVFNLAADMGGMGFIESHKALCMLSVLINTHLLMASRDLGVKRYFFSSSACVYASDKQDSPDVAPLREQDAYPAMPEDGYGWEKLFSERMCHHFMEDYGLETRVARYHNVYGPHGTYDGGREKAPAAICRKVVEAQMNGSMEIEVWGDGQQTRSFTYVDDSVVGSLMLMESDVGEPINIGSTELVTIDRLVDIVEEIAGVTLTRRYRRDAPQGVRGRNSDNSRIRATLGWEPQMPLHDGLAETYRWIERQMRDAETATPIEAAEGNR